MPGRGRGWGSDREGGGGRERGREGGREEGEEGGLPVPLVVEARFVFAEFGSKRGPGGEKGGQGHGHVS
jgi:hypothetical protein